MTPEEKTPIAQSDQTRMVLHGLMRAESREHALLCHVHGLESRIAALEAAIREHRGTVREFDPEAAQARDAEEKLWALLPD